MKSQAPRPAQMCAAAIATVVLTGSIACHSGGLNKPSVHPRPAGEPDAATLVQKYGGRAPRPCPAITGKPTDEEAAVLVQCQLEGPSAYGWERLLAKVKVHVTGTTKRFIQDISVDNSATKYQIQGEAYEYLCDPVAQSTQGHNCQGAPKQGTGICYRNFDGEYRCDQLEGPDPRYGNGLIPGGVSNIAPPTTF